MPRPQKDPLRPLTPDEYAWLERLSRSHSEPAAHVARAKALLAVAAGHQFTAAARLAGRRSGDAVAHLVRRFNREGLAAVEPGHGGGQPKRYTAREQARILQEVRRVPDRDADGDVVADHAAVCPAPGARRLAEDQHRHHLERAARSRVHLGQGPELVSDRHRDPPPQERRGDGDRSGCQRKKSLIEAAYRQGDLPVWTEDEAGPYQTLPYPGHHWHPAGELVRYAHEYVRSGTAKLLTLFHPASGEVRVKGVRSCPNVVLHPWLQAELTTILAGLPEPTAVASPAEQRRQWERWQEGLAVRISLPRQPPPLRMLLVMDNLTGHYTGDFVRWLFAHGIMPLYTPLGGSWLNMAESIQRILKRRALEGQHPQTPEEIIAWLEAAARGWNRAPTPFTWGGKRQARRQRARHRQYYSVSGSGACTRQPLPRSPAAGSNGYVQSN